MHSHYILSSISTVLLLCMCIVNPTFSLKGECSTNGGLDCGNFNAIVKTKDLCEDACRACEGGTFGCPDFKTNTFNGTDYYQCGCATSNTCADPRRGLCEDDLYSSNGARFFGIFGIVASALVGVFLY